MVKTYRPNNLKEALKIINEEECFVFAGGTDLMIRKRDIQGVERKFDKTVVFISQLKELRGIKEYEDRYEINSCTTQADIVKSDLPEYIRYPFSLMSTPAIQNAATVGGNIANAASVADSLPVFYALDALIKVESIEREKIFKIQDFIKAKYKTVLKKNELITKVIIPKKAYEKFAYEKLGQRKASILSKVSVYALFLKEKNKLKDLKISIGAVNDVPIREETLEKEFLKNRNLNKMLEGYKSKMNAKNDKRSTKRYRETVAINLIKKFLEEELS